MKIYLCAREDDSKLFNAWKMFCGHYDFVEITKQPILYIKNLDAVVSPANSFGFMTGGIDLHYKNYFGKQMEDMLQDRIKYIYEGELLVGQATVINVYHQDLPIKYVVSAPTMRLPQNISYTINSYLASRAALRVVKGLVVDSIAFPGMGTGTGQMNPNDCAKQVSVAIEEVVLGNKKFPNELYDELDYFKTNLASTKWFEVQSL